MAEDVLTLADWRRQVAEMYAAVRASDAPEAAWRHFRKTRDALFAGHPQTPLSPAQRRAFTGLEYFDYDPAYRVIATVVPVDDGPVAEMNLPADGLFRYRRVGLLHFSLAGGERQLALFWVEGYGGGLFLPFRDGSNSRGTYGGGRYLYDGIKGADLSRDTDRLLLDFNFAYNPSCAYDERWVCPLSPPENRLRLAIQAGEKAFH